MTTTKDPSAIYSKAWFEQHYEQKHEYRAIGDLIHETFGEGDVIDIGCGVALIIDRLAELGHKVTGIDGSIHSRNAAPPEIQDRIRIADITQPSDPLNDWLDGLVPVPIVICTEVAEHLEAQHADRLVSILSRLMAPESVLFFTAAVPGQGGHDHVNEQPNHYWIEKFDRLGRSFDDRLTTALRAKLRDLCPLMNFFARTTMVFR